MADDTNTAEREAFSCCNTWFESLPEGRKAVLRDDKWMLAHAAFQAGRASLAASEGSNEGSEPVAADGWLHENGLLYRLTDERHPCNRDEINVTMADGSRSIESRSRRALELLDRIRATHPSPPEGAGWRPIETAPKDAYVLLWADVAIGPPLIVQGCWFKVSRSEKGWIDTNGDIVMATHWMPLPSPPRPSPSRI